MSLETTYFKINFTYNVKAVERLIHIVHITRSRVRCRNVKHLVFRMMSNIVNKNCLNYLKLIKTLPISKDEIPSCDELAADCYIVYNHCVDNYHTNAGYNFYFYFNKALSRNFFRLFTKMKSKTDVENCAFDDTVTDNLLSLSVGGNPGDVKLLMDLLKFSTVERRICESRLSGQKNVDFLRQNKDISSSVYNSTLRNIKNKLIDYQNKGEM